MRKDTSFSNIRVQIHSKVITPRKASKKLILNRKTFLIVFYGDECDTPDPFLTRQKKRNSLIT